MQIVLITFVILSINCVIFCIAENPSKKTRQSGDRSFENGKLIYLNEIPWQALLMYKSKNGIGNLFGCGGVLVSSNFVMTSAHCVSDPNLKIVRLGEYDTMSSIDCIDTTLNDDSSSLDCTDPPVDILVDTIFQHPFYKPHNKNRHHDIALIKLKNHVNTTSFIEPVHLPSNNKSDLLKPGSKLIVSGWGVANYFRQVFPLKKIPNPFKQISSIAYLDKVTCKKILKSHNLKMGYGQFCAGYHNSCPGDDGNPVVVFNRDTNQLILVGITSSLTDCENGLNGIYTDIQKYLYWIHKIINSNQ